MGRLLGWTYDELISLISHYTEEEHFFWFDSNLQDPEQGRYSYVTWGGTPCSLDEMHFTLDQQQENFNLQNGYIGYITYDHGFEFEESASLSRLSDYPKVGFVKVDWYITFDHKLNACFLTGSKEFEDKPIPKHGYEIKDLNPSLDFNGYRKNFDLILNHIRYGNIYQANLTYPYTADFSGNAFDLYLKLRHNNPAFYGAFLKFKDLKILSSSPELFLSKRNSTLITKPIKGTRKRGIDECEDLSLEKDLLRSEKDNSELVMIVDLERNDLSRICSDVTGNYDRGIQKFASVQHLVGTVQGKLHPGITFQQVLKATFPGGSITGAPKISAMKILNEIEQHPRGVYTGIFGYITADYDFDFSIAIRTIIINNQKLTFSVGSGLTAESNVEEEFQETKDKALPLIKTLLS